MPIHTQDGGKKWVRRHDSKQVDTDVFLMKYKAS